MVESVSFVRAGYTTVCSQVQSAAGPYLHWIRHAATGRVQIVFGENQLKSILLKIGYNVESRDVFFQHRGNKFKDGVLNFLSY